MCFMQSLNSLDSSQPQWSSSGPLLHLCRTTIFVFVCIFTFAGRAILSLQDKHFCIFYFFSILAFTGRPFLHSYLCRTSIFAFFTFFHSCLCMSTIFAFLPLQDEQGVNSSCSHWQFDKTHFSSTIKWSFIAWMVEMKILVVVIDGLLISIEPG